MNSLLVLAALAATAISSPVPDDGHAYGTPSDGVSVEVSQSTAGTYRYSVNEEHLHRTEERLADGTVIGEYSTPQMDGSFKTVKYISDTNGFRILSGLELDKPLEFAPLPVYSPVSQGSDIPASVQGEVIHAAPILSFNDQTSNGVSGTYKFTVDEKDIYRSEEKLEDGTVTGEYTVPLEDGTFKTVKYRAGVDGFMILEGLESLTPVQFLPVPPTTNFASLIESKSSTDGVVSVTQSTSGTYKYVVSSKDSYRAEEKREDGTVIGEYSIPDKSGSSKTIKYSSGIDGFVILDGLDVSAPLQLLPVPAIEGPHFTSKTELSGSDDTSKTYKYTVNVENLHRTEERLADGTVLGEYSIPDSNGSPKVIKYRAGLDGFVILEGLDLTTPIDFISVSAPSASEITKDHQKSILRTEETSSDGTIFGEYDVPNVDGSFRKIKYSAGKDGFMILSGLDLTAPVEILPAPAPALKTENHGNYVDVEQSSAGTYRYTIRHEQIYRSEERLADGSIIGEYTVPYSDGTSKTIKFSAGLDGFMVLEGLDASEPLQFVPVSTIAVTESGDLPDTLTIAKAIALPYDVKTNQFH